MSPRPWVAAALSLAAGAAAAFAHPPWGILPGLLGYALLLRMVDDAGGTRPLRSAFWRGWLAAFAYFLVGCWWVAEAFMVDARGQGWMAPFAVMLLPAGLGLFWGAAMALYRAFAPAGPSRVLAFATSLALLEWLRGWVLTGFPWNLPGETWRAGSAISQGASLIGAYGLTFVTLAAAAAPATLLDRAGIRSRITAPVLAVLLLTTLAAWGSWRLRHAVAQPEIAPLIRIVQADVKQESKYDEDNLRSIFLRHLDLTGRPAARAPDIVVWSEGAIPGLPYTYMIEPGRGWAEAIRARMHPGQTLITGTYREAGTPEKPIYFNSMAVIQATSDGLRLTGVYDKYRLVPFGEFLPAEAILKPIGFKDLTHVGDSFTAGQTPRPIAPDAVPPVQPLICYEALFPDLVRKAIRRGPTRPRWIVNVSNDAWYGYTSGPRQHLNQASYRAIEEGLPIARATPTGVSAMIDAYGRTAPQDRLDLGKIGVIDAKLPAALQSTTYSRWGEWPFALLVMSGALAMGRGLRSLRPLKR